MPPNPRKFHWRYNDIISPDDLHIHGQNLINNFEPLCNNTRHVDRNLLFFAIKCIANLIKIHSIFYMTDRQTAQVKNILYPFQHKLKFMTNPNKRNYVVQSIRSQKGNGIFAGLIAAVIPLISTLISKMLNKKKKK